MKGGSLQVYFGNKLLGLYCTRRFPSVSTARRRAVSMGEVPLLSANALAVLMIPHAQFTKTEDDKKKQQLL